ncbi:MAG: hypothetical protein KDI38_28195, partial [Calditrichaeota bacterium]|nr:hypothetical protein [Calditrichota bacterium]
MLKLKPLLHELPEFKLFHGFLKDKKMIRLKGLYGSFPAAVIDFIKLTQHCPQLIVLPDGDAAEKLIDDLRSFMPESQAAYFPSDEVVPFDK